MDTKRLVDLLDCVQGLRPNQRQFGKTHAAAELTRRVGGVLVCMNQAHARQVAHVHGVPTESILSYDVCGRTPPPIVFDQDALVQELRAQLTRNRQLSDRFARLHAACRRVRDANRELDEVLDGG